jgi:hypothetical protein
MTKSQRPGQERLQNEANFVWALSDIFLYIKYLIVTSLDSAYETPRSR